MAKDPAFLFYSSDFMMGVSDLTMEERGQYITLLCLQHQKGRLTKKNIGIAVPNAAADVLAKFEVDENGNLFNKRLELEANKRKEHSEKQRQRAIDGWKKRKGATADATALPLEDVNENKDISIIKDLVRDKKKKKVELVYPFDSESFMDLWNILILESKWKKKSVNALQMSLKTLSECSEPEAKQMITNAIQGNYQGIFKINNSNNGTTKKRTFEEQGNRFLENFGE